MIVGGDRSTLGAVYGGSLVLLLGLSGCRDLNSGSSPTDCFDQPLPYVLEAPETLVDESSRAMEQVQEGHLRQWIELLTSPETRGRRAGTGDTAPVAGLLGRYFEFLALDPPNGSGYCRGFPAHGVTEFNVVGQSAGDPSPSLVVVAHYDGQGLHPTRGPLPGADDNASGVAAMLEFARLATRAPTDCRPPFAVIASSAEEIGRLGAQDLLDRPPFQLESVELIIVLDMIGRPADRDAPTLGYRLITPEGSAAGSLDPRVHAAAVESGVELAPMAGFGVRKPGSTDAEILGRAAPTILLSTGLHDDYHELGDTPDRIDLASVRRAVELLSSLRQQLCR